MLLCAHFLCVLALVNWPRACVCLLREILARSLTRTIFGPIKVSLLGQWSFMQNHKNLKVRYNNNININNHNNDDIIILIMIPFEKKKPFQPKDLLKEAIREPLFVCASASLLVLVVWVTHQVQK